jgi:hypothetical protein
MSTDTISEELYTQEELDAIRSEMDRWVQLDAQIKSLEAERKDITLWIADRVKHTAYWQQGTDVMTVTVVRPTTAEVDLEALQELDPKVYELVSSTKTVVDREALNQLIEFGMFGPGKQAAKALTYKSSSPSLRFKARSINAPSDDN